MTVRHETNPARSAPGRGPLRRTAQRGRVGQLGADPWVLSAGRITTQRMVKEMAMESLTNVIIQVTRQPGTNLVVLDVPGASITAGQGLIIYLGDKRKSNQR